MDEIIFLFNVRINAVFIFDKTSEKHNKTMGNNNDRNNGEFWKWKIYFTYFCVNLIIFLIIWIREKFTKFFL